ncbi:hypothetical protein ACRAWF_01540 [Streptomyces sp. L7]
MRVPFRRPALGSPLQLLLLACSFALAGYAGCGCSRTTGSGWRCGWWARPCCTTWCWCRCTRARTGRSPGCWASPGTGNGRGTSGSRRCSPVFCCWCGSR